MKKREKAEEEERKRKQEDRKHDLDVKAREVRRANREA